MEPAVNLRGRRIIVTRPAAQAQSLCQAIQQAGGSPLRLPLQRIRALASGQKLRAGLQAQPDWAIFTSTNAVAPALNLAPGRAAWPRHIAAVGLATAQALEQAGLQARFTPVPPFTSEGLLEQLSRYPLHNARVVLISGAGGRDAILSGLSAAGAQVIRINVYRRSPIALDKHRLRTALEQGDTLLISSGEGLQLLLSQCPDEWRERLRGLRLVVPSQRVLKMAEEAGFSGPAEIAKPMSETGIMQALGRVQNRE